MDCEENSKWAEVILEKNDLTSVRMETKLFILLFALALLLHPTSILAMSAEALLSVDYAMSMAERNSPSLSAAQLNEMAAKKSIDIARSAYYPIINAETIDSAGFPGSNQSHVLDVIGLMGSPFRKGLAGGVVAKQIVYDFGRTHYQVEMAKHEAESSHQTTRIMAYQVKLLALQLYYECAKYRTLYDIWSCLNKESLIINKEAEHFVNTGQVSIVDRYLSRAETQQTTTAKAFFAEQLQNARRELAILMGVPCQCVICPRLPNALSSSLEPNTPIDHSPFLWKAIAEAKAAQAKLQEEKARYRPRIIALASVGDMQHTVAHVKRSNYSIGAGVVVPLFNQGISGEIERAAALAAAKKQEIEAQELFLTEENAKYDRLICSSAIRLANLMKELKNAEIGYRVAKSRYFALEGNLLDLRAAFNVLSRVRSDVENTRTVLLQAQGSKALLNGSSISD
jgi:outer membrane protein